MDMDEETIRALIAQLTSLDYGARLIALGKLIEAGEAAVPALLEALKQPDTLLKACAACALAGIGSPKAARPLMALWEEAPLDPSRIEALVELVTRFSRRPTAGDIPALLELLPCHKLGSHTQGSSGTGHLVAALAAEGLSKLARMAPTPQLRAALPLLKRDFWNSVPEEFTEPRELIEDATRKWKDLPVTTFGPQTSAHDLPRPSSAD